jgi:hypothetical protein
MEALHYLHQIVFSPANTTSGDLILLLIVYFSLSIILLFILSEIKMFQIHQHYIIYTEAYIL